MKTLIPLLLLWSSKAFGQIPPQASMINYPSVNGSTITIRCLAADGVTYTNCTSGGGGGGSPGGANGNIQYNLAGSFNGAPKTNVGTSSITFNELFQVNVSTFYITNGNIISTFSLSGFWGLPQIQKPGAFPGLFYLDSATNKITYSPDGSTYLQVSTGTGGGSFVDFGPSTAALSNSTISLQTQINALSISSYLQSSSDTSFPT